MAKRRVAFRTFHYRQDGDKVLARLGDVIDIDGEQLERGDAIGALEALPGKAEAPSAEKPEPEKKPDDEKPEGKAKATNKK